VIESNAPGGRLRVLAVVARFKWSHIDYLAALGNEVDLWSTWSSTGSEGAPERAVFEGVRLRPLGALATDGEEAVCAALADSIERVQPDLIHVMYYTHERLTVITRRLAPGIPLVWECRDPITTLTRASPASPTWALEGEALRAADGHILVTEATRDYYERGHGVDLSDALIVPHAFAARLAGPLRPKLSSVDGRTHIALVGTAADDPRHGRYYVDIIRRLVAMGFVVHSHFHEEIDGVSLEPYERLDRVLTDYHHHPTVSFRDGERLSDLTSRYDLMGVFHELDSPEPEFNEAPTLEICMPTKAVSAWFHGAIPVVTFASYRGLVETIERLGIGFVVDDWEGVADLVGDHERIESASRACRAHREEFSHEYQARRIAAFYERVKSRREH